MPESVPIADSHPCNSDNVYGVSKFFIEQLCSYFSRRDLELEFVLFRLGVVIAENTPEPDVAALRGIRQPFCELGTIAEADAARAFVAAVEKCGSRGVRVLNLVAPVIRSPLNTVQTLAIVLGDRVDELDLSFYSLQGNERAGLFDVRAIEAEYPSAAVT
jgi:nucleoside-diphosphate-sugar epimerase